MVKFTVPLSDILGSAYYHYELSSSDYNPNIDSTITITCTCKNVLGNPISNKTLELYQNDTSKGTATTNANGIATWTITCSDWGIQDFRVKNQSIQVNVTGLKAIKDSGTTWSHLTYTLYVDEANRTVNLVVISDNSMSMGTGTDNYIFTNFVPSKYRPKSNMVGIVGRYVDILLWTYSSGTVGLANKKGSVLSNYGTQGMIGWSY